jgi:hypothetical protein
MQEYKRPPKTLPRIAGRHEEDWIRATRRGRAALTEMVLLGMLALRLKDQRLEWDSEKLRFTNNEQANELLHTRYRDGWTL